MGCVQVPPLLSSGLSGDRPNTSCCLSPQSLKAQNSRYRRGSLPYPGWPGAAARNCMAMTSPQRHVLGAGGGRGTVDELAYFVAEGTTRPGILFAQSAVAGSRTPPYTTDFLTGTCKHHKMFLFNIYTQSPTSQTGLSETGRGNKINSKGREPRT